MHCTPTKRQISKRLVYKTSGFKTSGLQNVRFTKRQVSKRMVSKRPVFKFDILIKQKVFVFVYLLLAIMVIYDKKTSKIENKTQPSLCLQTWTSTEYIYVCFFATRRFENLTFCKPDILST
jgi:hypothetical protein